MACGLETSLTMRDNRSGNSRFRPTALVVAAVGLSVLFCWFAAGGICTAREQILKVGAYENPPKIFIDRDGGVKGFWPELTAVIAAGENWRIQYVEGTWDECLNRLERGEIDLMPDMAYTTERSNRFAFSKAPVLVSWSRIYVNKGDVSIVSVTDLQGKAVGVLRNSVNFSGPEGALELFKKFNIHAEFVEMASYDDVFATLETGKIDAGITNKDFGRFIEKKYNVKKTAIIFQPVQIKFAFHRTGEKTPFLISRVNSQMERLISENGSPFYKILEKYFETDPSGRQIIVFPEWAKLTLKLHGCFFMAGILTIFLSRVQVKRKTLQLMQRNKELRESREKFQAVFEQTAMGVVICDSKTGEFLKVNEKYCRIVGYSRQELGRMSFHDLTHPEDRRNDLIYLNSVRVGNSLAIEKRYVHKDGRIVWVRINLSPLLREKDQQPCHIAIVEDITLDKNIRERLIQSEKMVATGGLAAGIAHEIQTPLAAMMMNAQIIINRISKPTKANLSAAEKAGTSFDMIHKFMKERNLMKILEAIHDSGKNAVSITEGILGFARKSDTSSHKQLQDITQLLDNTVAMVKCKPGYGRIIIERNYDGKAPLIPCDGNKIQQVFLNILLNGAEAMTDSGKPDGMMKFRLRVFQTDSGVRVRIEDTGPGFDRTITESLFKPFFSTKSAGKGTGLGLSISHYIVVEEHGGKIQAYSSPSGAVFIIDLPFGFPEAA